MKGAQRSTAALGAAMIALALAACAPDPAPTPTPTGFASEEEAFAAAEATYRAYVDAGNQVRIDPTRKPTPESFLTGSALDESIAADQQLSDAGVTLQGSSEVVSFRNDSWNSSVATVTVCMDVSGVRVIDESGNDVTPTTRPNRSSLQVEVLFDPDQPYITSSIVGDQTC